MAADHLAGDLDARDDQREPSHAVPKIRQISNQAKQQAAVCRAVVDVYVKVK
jgi:hypothetical protein